MRTRSEYRLSPIEAATILPVFDRRVPRDGDRETLASLLLAAYRGTIDDEGEDFADALAAIDHYLGVIVRDHSFVLTDGNGLIVAFSFVLIVDGLHYIDPVVVSPAWKGRGVGREATQACLASLAAARCPAVGATITDGNRPSERLFLSLGFVRHGAWG